LAPLSSTAHIHTSHAASRWGCTGWRCRSASGTRGAGTATTSLTETLNQLPNLLNGRTTSSGATERRSTAKGTASWWSRCSTTEGSTNWWRWGGRQIARADGLAAGSDSGFAAHRDTAGASGSGTGDTLGAYAAGEAGDAAGEAFVADAA